MILIYSNDDLTAEALQLTIPVSETVGYRASRYWRGEIEKASAVYTDDERIRKAYQNRGIKAEPITRAKPVAKKAVRSPKKTTTRRTTKAK